MDFNNEKCNRQIKTYGDVIRHMTNEELALFLNEIQAEIELGILAIMRAKMYLHRRHGVDDETRTEAEYAPFYSYKNFMERRIKYEPEDYGDVWGIKNWQDLMQWESEHKKNFGMDVVY